MFDTPDLGPLFFAPFIGLFVGAWVGLIVFILLSTVWKVSITKKVIISIVLASLLTGVACVASVALDVGAVNPNPWFPPKTGDIVGTWRLTATTVEALQDEYNAQIGPHELVFRDDKTFQINNIPSFWGLPDHANKKSPPYLNGSGIWELDRIQGAERLEWIIRSTFNEINGQPNHAEIRFYLYGHLPPYILLNFDSGPLIFRFQRK